jgi:signal transduction histidine kinase
VTDGDWTKSPTARRVIAHWADNRPAWLWSADGNRLVWRNRAARLFGARLKKGEIKLLPNAEPIRGQVPRLMRLGTQGHSSLSRLQFIAGERPISATCAVTPLTLANGQPAWLIVGVDAVDSAIFASAGESEPLAAKLLPEGSRFAVLDGDGDIIETSPDLAIDDPAALAGDVAEIGGDTFGIEQFDAGGGATLLLLTPMERPEEEHPAEESPAPAEPEDRLQEQDLNLPSEQPAPPSEPQPEEEPAGDKRLTALFDRLAEDENLYTPLGEGDDFPPQAVEPAAEAEAPEPEAEGEAAPAEPAAGDEGARRMLYRLVGRGFTPLAEEASDEEAEAEPATSEAGAEQPEEPAPPRDMESVERVSRYNFDELARILNDRVSGDAAPQSAPTSIEAIIEAEPEKPEPESEPTLESAPLPVPAAKTPGSGALINLGGETLVLNRLPLGILVFRDQQVLFANRAITEMTGYESVEGLRTAGLATIFPAAGEAQGAGPVNHLVQRDGTLVPVTARLQSVSWQGKPALMLSASTTEVRTGHEAAVRAFAEHLAASRADGFIETARSGVLTHVSADARLILARSEEQLLGRPVSALAAPSEIPALRAFFEKPARFAETARPAITVKGAERGIELMLFAQGQAGVISSYFGFVRRTEGGLPSLAAPAESDPGLLARLSRGVRRPLNTVIGFSDLIGSAAFGEIDNPRYLEYARDIKTAGLEIAALVDELDDFARLRDGRYTARPTDIDLAVLLDSSVTRVRAQANAARVLVRSAISERLPRIRADRASLAQAILNLLASAIDQTPQDGSVVLSAQLDDDGNVIVNVRDSAHNVADLGERFVVFRDGVGRDGETLSPVRSSVGLALTRALLAVNQASLSVDPAAGAGTLFSLTIPTDNIVARRELPAGPTA